MRILIYSHSSVESKAGGGLSAFRFARYLARSGRDVVQMAPNMSLRHAWAEVVDDVRIRRIPYYNSNRVQKALALPMLFAGAMPHVRRCDVLVIYGPIPCYGVLIIVAKTMRKRVIFRSTVMGQSDVESLIEHYAWTPSVRKWTLGQIDTYFSMHPAFTAAWVRTFGDDHKVVQTAQGVDTKAFAPVSADERLALRKELGLPVDKTIILSVGWMIKRKGFHEIFEAMSGIERDFCYVVVGGYEASRHHDVTPELREEMSTLTAQGRRDLGDTLRQEGPRDDVERYMAACDIFLLNSSQEGLPNVLLEAMSTGMCCVVRELDGVDNYLTFNGENAEVFRDPKGMMEALERVSNDPERRRRIGDNAAEFIREHFSYEAVARKLFG